MIDTLQRRYTPASAASAYLGANISGLIAATAAPLYLYFGAGAELWIALATAPFGFALAWVLFGLRQRLGGVSAIVVSGDGLSLEKRKEVGLFPWRAITSVRFTSVNSTPWLDIHADTRQNRVCLETFLASDVESLMQDIANHLENGVSIEHDASWTLLNRSVIRK